MNLIKHDSKIFSLPDIQIDLHGKSIEVISYYPINRAEKLYQRQILQNKNNLNHIKYVFVYFGGNNQIYYKHALPIFFAFFS